MRRRRRVSIPFIAGQWSLLGPGSSPCAARRRVSIPFIAGQWSLRSLTTAPPQGGAESFNPLHCGAVVASGWPTPFAPPAPRVSIPFIAGQWSLPKSRGLVPTPPVRVSIPFIAGQWSLPEGRV